MWERKEGTLIFLFSLKYSFGKLLHSTKAKEDKALGISHISGPIYIPRCLHCTHVTWYRLDMQAPDIRYVLSSRMTICGVVSQASNWPGVNQRTDWRRPKKASMRSPEAPVPSHERRRENSIRIYITSLQIMITLLNDILNCECSIVFDLNNTRRFSRTHNSYFDNTGCPQ
jgi:hypothetical protein